MRSIVRVDPGPPHGDVAQLGERLPCTQEVIGSIPFTSTIFEEKGRRIKEKGKIIRQDEQAPGLPFSFGLKPLALKQLRCFVDL